MVVYRGPNPILDNMTQQSTDSTLPCVPNPALVSDIANQPLHAFPKSTDFKAQILRPTFQSITLPWHYLPIEETEVTLVCSIEEEAKDALSGGAHEA